MSEYIQTYKFDCSCGNKGFVRFNDGKTYPVYCTCNQLVSIEPMGEYDIIDPFCHDRNFIGEVEFDGDCVGKRIVVMPTPYRSLN